MGRIGGVTCAATRLKVRRFMVCLGLTCSVLYAASPEYFSNLDGNQMRLDQLQRPELRKGTVDFVLPSSNTAYNAPHPPPRLVPSTYSPEPPPSPSTRRTPEFMHFLFALDVSSQSQQSGFLKAACDSLRAVLYGGEVDGIGRVEPCFPISCKIGFITYDDTVHFHDLSVCYLSYATEELH